MYTVKQMKYRNDSKLSGQTVACVDLDQTAPESSKLFFILSASFGHIIVWYNHTVQIIGK